MASETNITGFLYKVHVPAAPPCTFGIVFDNSKRFTASHVKVSERCCFNFFANISTSSSSVTCFQRCFLRRVWENFCSDGDARHSAGARAVAQMSWKYPRRPPNSHEYPPWRMMRVWAVKYVHLRSSEHPKTQHTHCKYCVSLAVLLQNPPSHARVASIKFTKGGTQIIKMEL